MHERYTTQVIEKYRRIQLIREAAGRWLLTRRPTDERVFRLLNLSVCGRQQIGKFDRQVFDALWHVEPETLDKLEVVLGIQGRGAP